MLQREHCFNKAQLGNSLALQWLGLQASTAGSTGSIPGQGTVRPRLPCIGQKKKKKAQLLSPQVIAYTLRDLSDQRMSVCSYLSFFCPLFCFLFKGLLQLGDILMHI